MLDLCIGNSQAESSGLNDLQLLIAELLKHLIPRRGGAGRELLKLDSVLNLQCGDWFSMDDVVIRLRVDHRHADNGKNRRDREGAAHDPISLHRYPRPRTSRWAMFTANWGRPAAGGGLALRAPPSVALPSDVGVDTMLDRFRTDPFLRESLGQLDHGHIYAARQPREFQINAPAQDVHAGFLGFPDLALLVAQLRDHLFVRIRLSGDIGPEPGALLDLGVGDYLVGDGGLLGLRAARRQLAHANERDKHKGPPRDPVTGHRHYFFVPSTSRTGVSGVTPPRRRANVSLPLISHSPFTARRAKVSQSSAHSPSE